MYNLIIHCDLNNKTYIADSVHIRIIAELY